MDASNGLGESNINELRSRRLVQPQKTLKEPKTSWKRSQRLTMKRSQNKARTLTESFGQCIEEAPNQSVTKGSNIIRFWNDLSILAQLCVGHQINWNEDKQKLLHRLTHLVMQIKRSPNQLVELHIPIFSYTRSTQKLHQINYNFSVS